MLLVILKSNLNIIRKSNDATLCFLFAFVHVMVGWNLEIGITNAIDIGIKTNLLSHQKRQTRRNSHNLSDTHEVSFETNKLISLRPQIALQFLISNLRIKRLANGIS